jgi:4,5-DOPA dioxygenase extradiol
MPVVFVSHGAPDALLAAPDAVACWQGLGQSVPAPKAVLAVSAHWQARNPTASLSGAPESIHDFSGFSPVLHRMQYPAPGAPALAERTAALLSGAGFTADLHPGRGLDHGAWVPLSAMYPQANVPVTQLSLMRNDGPAAHFAMGQALAPLREEGVLILASGAITHNFGWLDWRADTDAPPLPTAKMFADWVGGRLAARDVPALLDYRSTRRGAEAHPSEEHFLPLFVALGAAGGEVPMRRRPRFAYRGLAMDAYVW